MVGALLEDRYAKGTTAANASILKTWQHCHHEAFDHVHPPLPLLPITVPILVMVGALLKAGVYRSYPNYISIMHIKHIEAGHEWCQLLVHTSSWVIRSVMRGIGPDRQSCSFDVRRLWEIPRTSAPLTEQGPCNPIHLSILATMFLLREVEVTTARVSSWTLSISDKERTWHLPGSN